MKIGDRAGAVLSADEEEIRLLGYGVFQGDRIPDPALGVACYGVPMLDPNPCIQLDDGKLVFGCECWWSSEDDIRKIAAEYAKVVFVDIEEERKSL
jgi:hypothetical protein